MDVVLEVADGIHNFEFVRDRTVMNTLLRRNSLWGRCGDEDAEATSTWCSIC